MAPCPFVANLNLSCIHATIMGHNMCFVFICCFSPLVLVEKCYEIGYHRYQLWVCMQQLRENSECFNIFIWRLSSPPSIINIIAKGKSYTCHCVSAVLNMVCSLKATIKISIHSVGGLGSTDSSKICCSPLLYRKKSTCFGLKML